jgi:vacuolar protein sorting-associated protein 13A/C
MRLIDVCIPHFGDEHETAGPALPPTGAISAGFQLPATLFGQSEQEYNVDDDYEDHPDNRSVSQEEQFFEAEDGSLEVSRLLCSIIYFELKKLLASGVAAAHI